MIFCIFLDCFFIKSIHYIRALKQGDFYHVFFWDVEIDLVFVMKNHKIHVFPMFSAFEASRDAINKSTFFKHFWAFVLRDLLNIPIICLWNWRLGLIKRAMLIHIKTCFLCRCGIVFCVDFTKSNVLLRFYIVFHGDANRECALSRRPIFWFY